MQRLPEKTNSNRWQPKAAGSPRSSSRSSISREWTRHPPSNPARQARKQRQRLHLRYNPAIRDRYVSRNSQAVECCRHRRGQTRKASSYSTIRRWPVLPSQWRPNLSRTPGSVSPSSQSTYGCRSLVPKRHRYSLRRPDRQAIYPILGMGMANSPKRRPGST